MIDLAAAPTDADHPGTPYRYVAANLANLNANLSGVEPFAMVNVGGAKVAVIGIVNEEAPGLVSPGSFGTIQVTDGVAAANKWAEKARKAGANAVVVITHKGVRGTNLDGSFFGELVDFANDVDSSLIDVIIGDHTDIRYEGVHDGILVHENRSKGATYTRTSLNVSPGKGGTVHSKSVTFVTPTAPARTAAQLIAADCPDSDVAPDKYCDEDLLEVLIPYRQELALLLDPKIATTTGTFVRGGNIERRQEVALGNLVAEGMRWYQGTDFAFVNGGGIRSPLPSSYVPLDAALSRPTDGDPAPWDLVLGDVYSVLPFTNTVLRRTVTGNQLWRALENGVSRIDAAGNSGDGRFPQIAGFEFTFNYDLPTGCTGNPLGGPTWSCEISRVTSVTRPDGTPVPPDDTVYTLAIPSFTNQGGDSYQIFLNHPQTGENEALDAKVMADYIAFLGNGGFPVLDPTKWVDGRIVKCGAAHPCP
jgi:5'-nucleotidase